MFETIQNADSGHFILYLLAAYGIMIGVAYALPAITQFIALCFKFVNDGDNLPVNIIHKLYFCKLLGCSDESDSRSHTTFRDGKVWLSEETYYDSCEYYFHWIINLSIAIVIIGSCIKLPMVLCVILSLVGGLFGTRTIIRLGKKVVGLSTALTSHIKEKNAHGGES